MSEVKRLSLDLEYPFQYREDTEGKLCYYADYAALKEQVVELQKQCDALAAENANLQHLLSMIGETGNANFGRTKLHTPATDAYLNSVRAEAIESFAHHQRVIADATPEHGCHRHRRFAAGLAEDFAAQLRAGEPS